MPSVADEPTGSLELAILLSVAAAVAYCCCRNCVLAACDCIRCCWHCCTCACCRSGRQRAAAADEEEEEGVGRARQTGEGYATLEEQEEDGETAGAAVAASGERTTGRSSARSIVGRLGRLVRSPSSLRRADPIPSASAASAAIAAPNGCCSDGDQLAVPVATPAGETAVAVPIAPYVPPRARVLNPKGHFHGGSRRAVRHQALLECSFCLLFLMIFAILWWYVECEAHYFHHSCAVLYRYSTDGEQSLRPLQPPSWYVQHLLDNQNVVRTGPTMAQRAAMGAGPYNR